MNLKSKVFIVILIYLVQPLAAVAQGEIVITGVEGKLKQNILTHLQSHQIDCEANDLLLRSLVEKTPAKVLSATKPFGYYNPKIEISPIGKNKKCWSLEVKIEQGKPILLSEKIIEIIGSEEDKAVFQELVDQADIKIDKPFKDFKYENLKSELQDLASQLGYLDAKLIKNQIDIYPDEYLATFEIVFDLGARYTIKKVDIAQSPYFLNDQFIRKLILLKSGDLLSNKNLFDTRKKLKATGYFDQVSIDLGEKAENQISIRVNLTPAKRIQYSAGIGFSTDTGPRSTLEYKHNRLGEYGYQFNSKLNVSKVISELSTGVKIPSKSKPLRKWYNLDAGFRIERTDVLSSDTSKLGMSQTRIHENKWQNINYLDLVNEKFDVGVDRGESFLLVPGTSWSLIHSDNPTFPRRGYKVQVDLKGASSSIFSDVSFAQISFDYKGILPVGDDNRFIYRANLGSTISSNFEDLPTSYRFFTGGDNSIRGYDYETLAPISSDGDVIGGKHLLVVSMEYEHRFKEQWAVALFTDAGNAFTQNFKLEQSVGAGLRWFSPIGPVRFDVGVPINNSESGFEIHITLGPDL